MSSGICLHACEHFCVFVRGGGGRGGGRGGGGDVAVNIVDDLITRTQRNKCSITPAPPLLLPSIYNILLSAAVSSPPSPFHLPPLPQCSSFSQSLISRPAPPSPPLTAVCCDPDHGGARGEGQEKKKEAKQQIVETMCEV